jgi:hypothetical protein
VKATTAAATNQASQMRHLVMSRATIADIPLVPSLEYSKRREILEPRMHRYRLGIVTENVTITIVVRTKWIRATLSGLRRSARHCRPWTTAARPEQRNHDYMRHGTTTLFAALEVATGRITNQCAPRQRHQEFLTFLKQVAGAYPRYRLRHCAQAKPKPLR